MLKQQGKKKSWHIGNLTEQGCSWQGSLTDFIEWAGEPDNSERKSHQLLQNNKANSSFSSLYHVEYHLLLLQLKAVVLNLVYFHLDEHFQVNQLLNKYWI